MSMKITYQKISFKSPRWQWVNPSEALPVPGSPPSPRLPHLSWGGPSPSHCRTSSDLATALMYPSGHAHWSQILPWVSDLNSAIGKKKHYTKQETKSYTLKQRNFFTFFTWILTKLWQNLWMVPGKLTCMTALKKHVFPKLLRPWNNNNEK